MNFYGIFVLVVAALRLLAGTTPEPPDHGTRRCLVIDGKCRGGSHPYQCRDGDANMRSVWLRLRNAAIGSAAVMLAALEAFGMNSGLPALAVAAVIATLAIWSGSSTVMRALKELRWRSPRAMR